MTQHSENDSTCNGYTSIFIVKIKHDVYSFILGTFYLIRFHTRWAKVPTQY